MTAAAIGLDIRMIRNTGIGTYIRGLLESWQETGLANQFRLALFGAQENHKPFASLPFFAFNSPIYSIQEQLEYPFRLRDCALWHAPHYNVPLLKSKTKLVVTIHDLIHWIFRKDFYTPLQALYAKTLLQHAVTKSDHMITVSQKTREDLIQYFDADPERITVIAEGVHKKFQELENGQPVRAVLEKYFVPKNYFLYVGSLKPHKNVLGLIHLFRKLKAEHKLEASLVIIGRKDKHYPRGYEELTHLKTEKELIYLPFVEEDELVAFYNGALALVHPSLYEGFGLTLLEAMACGAPVIACRSASVPEVVGEAAYLVDPCVEREMSDAMIRLEKVPGMREEFKRKGKLRAAHFQWQDAAKKTIEIYEKVLAQS